MYMRKRLLYIQYVIQAARRGLAGRRGVPRRAGCLPTGINTYDE